MRDTSFYQGPYLHDVLDQPRALSATIDALQPNAGLGSLRERLRGEKHHRLVLTGMGTSYNVLYPLHFRLLAAGFDSLMIETSELLTTVPQLLAPDNVLLVVSQSGASAETVRLLEGPGSRPFTIGVTNTPGSPLDRKADVVVTTHAGEEATVSCKTAVTALAALEWVGEQICGGDLDALRTEFRALPEAVAAYVAPWPEHVRQLQLALANVTSFFAVGRGRSLAAAEIGGMIQKEAAYVHGEGMSAPAFRHGPMEFLTPEIFLMVFDGDPEVSPLNRALWRDRLKDGGRAALVGWEETEGVFLLPPAPSRFRPILEMLPPQMVSLALGGLKGHKPGKFARLGKVTTTE